MALSLGIVGLLNVGKSTLFQALTKKEVNVANYPFATIDPNVGIVEVPDERLDKLAALFHSKKKVPAIVEFVDIAGLVRGANKGEGLGNKFLANIREVQAICQVVRAFQDPNIQHVANRVDPEVDMETVETELLLKDMETVEKRLQSIEKEARAGEKEAVALREALEGVTAFFNQGRPVREFMAENPDMAEHLLGLQLLTAKPQIVAISADSIEEVPGEFIKRLKERNISFLVMNMREELEVSRLAGQEASELGLSSKLPQLISLAYETLDLQTFFTAGEDETRAWTIKKGMVAPQAGGVIHSDFEEKFIKASVIDFNKLLEAEGYAQAASKGWLRTEGKEYVVKDGDVIEIKHG